MDSPLPGVRAGAVLELGKWLRGGGPRNAAAVDELRIIAQRDVPEVAEAARGCLDEAFLSSRSTGDAAPTAAYHQYSHETGRISQEERAGYPRIWEVPTAGTPERLRTGDNDDPWKKIRTTVQHVVDDLWLLPTFLGVGLLSWIGFLYVGLRARNRRWNAVAGLNFLFMVLFMTLVPDEEEMPPAFAIMMMANWAALIIFSLRENKTWLRNRRNRRAAR